MSAREYLVWITVIGYDIFSYLLEYKPILDAVLVLIAIISTTLICVISIRKLWKTWK